MSKDSITVSIGWDDRIESTLGHLVISPNPYADLAWQLLNQYPDLYSIETSYITDPETGDKKLVGLSLIQKQKETNENSSARQPRRFIFE